MTRPAFSAPVAAALDSYNVPPLPAGFADRLIARAANDAAVTTPEQPAMPRQRPSSPHSRSPWARVGRIMGSIGAIGFVTAAAAAAGFFGERIYVPGVTEILVEAQVIPSAKASNSKMIAAHDAQSAPGVATADAKLAAASDNSPPTQIQPGRTTTQHMLRSLAADPEFRKLPASQKRAAVKKAARQLVRSGQATPAEIRSALRQRRAAGITRSNIPPEILAKRRARVAKHIAAKRLAAKTDAAPTLTAKAPISNIGPQDVRTAVKSAIVKSAAGSRKPVLTKVRANTDSGKIYTVIEPPAAVLAPPPRTKRKAAIDRARLPTPPAGASRRDVTRDAVRPRRDAKPLPQRPTASRPRRGGLKPAPSRSKPRPAPRPKPHRPG